MQTGLRVESKLGSPLVANINKVYMSKYPHLLSDLLIIESIEARKLTFKPSFKVGYSWYGYTLPAKTEVNSVNDLYAKYRLFDGRLTVSNVAEGKLVKIRKYYTDFNATQTFTIATDHIVLVGDKVKWDKILYYVSNAINEYDEFTGWWRCSLSLTLNINDITPTNIVIYSTQDKKQTEGFTELKDSIKDLFNELLNDLKILLGTGIAGPYPVTFSAGLPAFESLMNAKIAEVEANLVKIIAEIKLEERS